MQVLILILVTFYRITLFIVLLVTALRAFGTHSFPTQVLSIQLLMPFYNAKSHIRSATSPAGDKPQHHLPLNEPLGALQFTHRNNR